MRSGSRPWRSRHSAQISVGMTAHVDIALSRSVASSTSCDARKPSVAPYCDTAVRSASSGTNVVARARDRGQHVGDRGGIARRGPDVGRERFALARASPGAGP